MIQSSGRLLLLLFAAGQAFAADWQESRFDGRDYVSVEKLSEFYNLPREATPLEKNSALTRGRRSLLLTVGSREVEINGVKYALSFPVIEREGKHWFSRMDLGKTIEPAFRPELIPNLKTFTTVVLDPGHGGEDKGAASPYEVEKNFTLDVARRVRDELKKAGLNVIMTRNTDTFIELPDRAAMANRSQNSLFVSIHFNASPNFSASGLEIFCVTPRGSPSTEYDDLLVRDMVQEYGNENELQSFALASAIYHALQGSSLGMLDRGLKRARFVVLCATRMPSVLIEGGFLSNPGDARLVAGKDWRNKYARAIATGILEYQKLAAVKKAPRLAADYRDSPAGATTAGDLPGPTPDPSGSPPGKLIP
ncbi:MAG: N-acetylmuramoyl-L-alanine amidase [Verrucomicrobiota bacterium]